MSTLISEPPLQVLPSLAKEIGLNEAIVLQQIHYWLIRSKFTHDGRKWIYNTIPQWQEQFPFWSEDTILRILKKLKLTGYLRGEMLAKSKFDKTMYYAINYDKLRTSIPATCDYPESHIEDISNKEQETTTENTNKRSRKKSDELTMNDWLQKVADTGERAIPEKSAVFEFADKAKIPHEFIAIAWHDFKTEFRDNKPTKRQANWRQTFYTYIKNDWLKIWYFDKNNNQYCLTNKGMMIKTTMEAA